MRRSISRSGASASAESSSVRKRSSPEVPSVETAASPPRYRSSSSPHTLSGAADASGAPSSGFSGSLISALRSRHVGGAVLGHDAEEVEDGALDGHARGEA